MNDLRWNEKFAWYHFNYDEIYNYTCPCCQRTQWIEHDKLSEEIVFDLMHPKK